MAYLLQNSTRHGLWCLWSLYFHCNLQDFWQKHKPHKYPRSKRVYSRSHDKVRSQDDLFSFLLSLWEGLDFGPLLTCSRKPNGKRTQLKPLMVSPFFVPFPVLLSLPNNPHLYASLEKSNKDVCLSAFLANVINVFFVLQEQREPTRVARMLVRSLKLAIDESLPSSSLSVLFSLRQRCFCVSHLSTQLYYTYSHQTES